MSKQGQTSRLREHFKNNPNEDISALKLHRIASGSENGFCASISKRISELRCAFRAEGGDLILSRDEMVNGTRHTWYRYNPEPNPDLVLDNGTKVYANELP